MSSDPDPIAGHLRSSAGSKSTDLRRDLRILNPLNSSWIRRLHVSSSVPPPAPPRTQTISSNGSRTPKWSDIDLRSPRTRVVRLEVEHSKEVSGFGPFQFKGTNQDSTRQFPLVEKVAGFNCDQTVAGRHDRFKISPFFQFFPPLSNSQLTLPHFSPRHFPTHKGEAGCHGEATHTADPTVRFQDGPPNYTNQQEVPFSYWNLGRFKQINTNSSASQIPLRNNLQKKRNPITDLFFPSKFRKSGDES